MEKIKDRHLLIKQIASDVLSAGGRAYYVGGFVRDLLRGKISEDIDIEVHGLAPDLLEAIIARYSPYDILGKSFGIYSLRYHHIDIALPRKETKTGLKHQDFRIDVDPFIGTYSSCQRRDFTINALMMDVLDKKIIDHFNGLTDLKGHIIRHINDAAFLEDPLRVLRAARFSATLDFKIAPETIALCQSSDLSYLAKERVLAETNKALLGQKPSSYFISLAQMQQLDFFYPELKKLIDQTHDPALRHKDAFEQTMMVLDEAAKCQHKTQRPRYFMYAALLHDIEKSTMGKHDLTCQEIVKHALLHISNEKHLLKYVQKAVLLYQDVLKCFHDNFNDASIIRLLDRFKYPKDLLFLGSCVIKTQHTGDYDQTESKKYIAWAKRALQLYEAFLDREHVGGHDIIALGYKGKIVKAILKRARYLEAAVFDKDEVLKIITQEFKL